MDVIYKIVKDFILDSSKSIGQRAGFTVLIIVILFSIDYVFNFTYDINISNKINTLEKINQLKTEYNTDSLYMIQLLSLEKEYKNRKHYSSYFIQFLNFTKSLFKSDTKEIIRNQIKKDNTITNSPIRSNFWMFISSNFFFVLLSIFIILTPFIGKDTNTAEMILGLFLILIIVVLIMLFVNWTAHLIPLLFNNPAFNYLLNFIIHTCFVTIITMRIIKSSKKKNA